MLKKPLNPSASTLAEIDDEGAVLRQGVVPRPACCSRHRRCSLSRNPPTPAFLTAQIAASWALRFNIEEAGHRPVRFLDTCLVDMLQVALPRAPAPRCASLSPASRAPQRKGAPRALLEEVVDGPYERRDIRGAGGAGAQLLARF